MEDELIYGEERVRRWNVSCSNSTVIEMLTTSQRLLLTCMFHNVSNLMQPNRIKFLGYFKYTVFLKIALKAWVWGWEYINKSRLKNSVSYICLHYIKTTILCKKILIKPLVRSHSRPQSSLRFILKSSWDNSGKKLHTILLEWSVVVSDLILTQHRPQGFLLFDIKGWRLWHQASNPGERMLFRYIHKDRKKGFLSI